jgi:DNA polymerase-3 subunit epsilon
MRAILKSLFKTKANYPHYWENYVNEFKHKNNQRLVVLDCETTGLMPDKDKILSIGAVAVHQNIIFVEDHFSVFLEQDVCEPKSVPIHGIIKNTSEIVVTEAQAIQDLLVFLGNSKIVGHHIQFDIQILNQSLKRLNLPKLKNKTLDTNDLYSKYKGISQPMQKTLDDLCDEFDIIKKDRHTALGDAFLTAQVYQRLRA